MQILSIIFPIVFIVSLGYFYARRYRPDMTVANQLTLRIFVPALVLDVLSSSNFEIVTYKWLALGGVIVVFGSGLIAWPLGKILKYPNRLFVPCMMFNNCGNLGLPLAVLAFGEPALEAAVVLLLVSNLLHFTVGVYMYGGGISIKDLLLNPVNIAAVLALIINFSQIAVPQIILYPLHLLAQIVIPLMLFSLGARILNSDISHIKMGVVSGFVCPIAGIIFGVIGGWLLNLNEHQYAMLILFSALPPAVLNFLIAERYAWQSQQVASIVVVSHVVAVIILPLVLWWLL